MSFKFTPINYQEQGVGKRIKSSKKKIIWNFNVQGKAYQIIILYSRMSGKIRIFLNGTLNIITKKNTKAYKKFPIAIGNYTAIVEQISRTNFDLKIQGQSFDQIYNHKSTLSVSMRKNEVYQQRKASTKEFQTWGQPIDLGTPLIDFDEPQFGSLQRAASQAVFSQREPVLMDDSPVPNRISQPVTNQMNDFYSLFQSTEFLDALLNPENN